MPIHIKKENPGASARDFFLFRFFDNGKAFVFVLRIINSSNTAMA
ncbi:hypothetical protein MY7_3362 [Bacillus sp. 5B6]|nr:hypothetical protein MY7_3362 [Bacillus sp. 5B6]